MNEHIQHHCADREALLVDVLFGDADADQRADLASHLAACQGCKREFDSLSETLSLTSDRAPFRPDEAMLARLEDRVLAQTTLGAHRSIVGGRLSHMVVLPQWWRQAAAVAAVLIVGVLIGRVLPRDAEPALAAAPDAELTGPELTEARAHDYLNRSKTLLLGVVNFDPSTEDPASLDLAQRRVVANELLVEADYLRTNLSRSEQQRLKALVSELEVILLQLANLEERADIPEIEIVQSGVDRNGLLFKIDVEKMRQSAAPKAPKPPAASV